MFLKLFLLVRFIIVKGVIRQDQLPFLISCGIDEAGRGPIAGPVTAAAVVLPLNFPVQKLDDSKRLTPVQREKIALLIRDRAAAWSTGWCTAYEIDQINIHKASLIAMWRALRSLGVRPHRVLIDGKFPLKTPQYCSAIIKGDTKVPEIMAASIIAKTERDRFMSRYGRIEPIYEFEKHKGYPTVKHRTIVKHYGLSPIHRKSFRIKKP